jgi:nicotinate-nucleotide adenylyltransferase
MAAIAVAGDDTLAVSDLELSRPGPTYTCDTLHALAADGYRPSQIFFITGADAFAGIETWHRFPEVLDAGHFAVVARPGHTLPEALRTHPLIAPRLRTCAEDGRGVTRESTKTCGIWLVCANTPDVSSSEIRQRLLTGEEVGPDVPASVAEHIRRHGLYTPATAARRLHGEN